MFEEYPKVRPPLPREIEAIYAAEYKSNREGETAATSVGQRMERWLHRRVADDVRDGSAAPGATLELGAGTLNQLPFEAAHEGPYDIVEPFESLFAGSPGLARVRDVFADIEQVPAGRRYDRITSVAVLEHVLDLPRVVARSGLLLAEGGCFRASIPSEGTLLWTLGWTCTTGLEFRLRHGLDYGQLMRHEHVNTAREIETVLRHFFRDVGSRVFGLSKSFSFYQFHACRRPDLDRCRAHLEAVGAEA